MRCRVFMGREGIVESVITSEERMMRRRDGKRSYLPHNSTTPDKNK